MKPLFTEIQFKLSDELNETATIQGTIAGSKWAFITSRGYNGWEGNGYKSFNACYTALIAYEKEAIKEYQLDKNHRGAAVTRYKMYGKQRITIEAMNDIARKHIQNVPSTPAYDLTVFDADLSGDEVVRIAKSLTSLHLAYILKYAHKSISRNAGITGKLQIEWIVTDVHWEKVKDENKYSAY